MKPHAKVFAGGVLAALWLAFGWTPAVLAEVSAETDPAGQYVRMIYLTNASSKNLKIWSVRRSELDGVHPLNREGDSLGDMWPVYVEDPFEGLRPYVVWSRFNGYDLDLVWARWTDTGWSEISPVERFLHSGQDLDPNVAADPEDGRPTLAWCSDVDGVGRIYLSIFLRSRWMDRFLVSDLDVDSRYPDLVFLEGNRVQVTYETPDGPESRVIVFKLPNTITDDIDPMTHLSRETLSQGGGY